MKILKVTLIALLAVCLTAVVAMAEPGKGKGEAKGHDKEAVHENHGAAQAENHGATAKVEAHLRNALRKQARAAQEEQPGEPSAPPPVPNEEKPGLRHGTLKSAEQALVKLEHARWAYNPNDTRGQGNMGRVDMMDPYGHDKDSDRLELYGNRGRVIREVPESEPPPQEPPQEEPPAPQPPPPQPPQEEPPAPQPPPDWPPF